MAKEGCVRYKCSDEDECQEWSGPRWYSICADTCICVSVEVSVMRGVSGRT